MSSFDQRPTIHDDLRRIRSDMEELQGLVSLLADEPAEVRDIWHWQCDSLMAWVDVLCKQRRDGLFTQEQEEEFAVVSRLITDSRTLLEQLGCRIPIEFGEDAYASG